jgi:hypothetical protein
LALKTGLSGFDAIAPAAPACPTAKAVLLIWQALVAGTLMRVGSSG